MNNKDIAIIGMAGRFPGAEDTSEFWQNLCEGRESITFFSEEELRQRGVSDALLQNPNYIKAMPVLNDMDCFDADFFDVTAREAIAMDPQHRVFLECAWKALEDAGYADGNKQLRIGVFGGSGCVTTSYILEYVKSHPTIQGTSANYHTYCNDRDHIPTRVAFKLNLTGPAINVQTACSTSMVAVHLACESLLRGECDMVLAGGVNVRVPHHVGYLYAEGDVYSHDGHCRTFDAESTGMMFGGGVALVLLKPLDKAVEDGDIIYAVIKGSAINNDGNVKQSYSAPSVQGQEGCMARALESGDVDAATITYVEAHGTGTIVGDPIEVESLTRAFRRWTNKLQYCALGSIKPNIGHLGGASGIASLIKVALALYYKKIPPLINYQTPNPRIKFEEGPFYPNTQLKEWEKNGTPRRAAVNSFGVGGTNASVVLEEAPVFPPIVRNKNHIPRFLLTWSAKTPDAVNLQAENLAHFLKANPTLSLEDIAFTLNCSRRHFEHRAFLQAATLEEAEKVLLESAYQQESLREVQKRPKVAFIFSGQGTQYQGMAQKLYNEHPLFRETIDRCAAVVKKHVDIELCDLLFDIDNHPLAAKGYAQIALFALQYGLYVLLRSWGVQPAFILGHSFGEYVAATAAGILSLEEGISLAAHRCQFLNELPNDGGMLAILTNLEKVETLLNDFLSRYPQAVIEIATINSPNQTVVSGKKTDLDLLEKEIEGSETECRALRSSYAFHSSLLAPMLPKLHALAKTFTFAKPKVDFISTFKADRMQEGSMTPEYWVDQTRGAVQFKQTVAYLEENGCSCFIEIGPNPALLGAVRDSLRDYGACRLIGTLKRGQDDWGQLLDLLGKLHLFNVEIDLGKIHEPVNGKKISLPTYPFERKRFWVDPPETTSSQVVQTVIHPLLGWQAAELAMGGKVYENILNDAELSYLVEHVIYEHTLLPFTGYLEILCAAAAEFQSTDSIRLKDVAIESALEIKTGFPIKIQTMVIPGDEGCEITIYSLGPDQKWRRHASCTALQGAQPELQKRVCPTLPEKEQQIHDMTSFYAAERSLGRDYGPQFQLIRGYWTNKESTLGELAIDTSSDGYHAYPPLLDAVLQMGHISTGEIKDNKAVLQGSIPLPLEAREVFFYKPLTQRIIAEARADERNGEKVVSTTVWSDTGELLVEIIEILRKTVDRSQLDQMLTAASGIDGLLYVDEWVAQELPKEKQLIEGTWMIIAAEKNKALAKEISDSIANNGACSFCINYEVPYNQFPPSVNTESIRGIVNLLPLDVESPFIEATVGLMQTIIRTLPYEKVPVFVVTSGVNQQTVDLNGVKASPLVGLLRSIKIDFEDLMLTHIDMDYAIDHAGQIERIMKEITYSNGEPEVLYRDESRYVNRIVHYKEYSQRHHLLQIPKQPFFRLIRHTSKKLEKLSCENFSIPSIKDNEVEVEVGAVGLNFRDILNAMGLYPGDPGHLGSECSGRILRKGNAVKDLEVGDAVVGFAFGAFADRVITHEDCMLKLPEGLSFTDAAGIPVVFATAYYALIQLAQLGPKDKVLIHSATGGIGLAAIQIAKHVGAEIYATAGSEKKRDYLRSLGIKHVSSSRDLQFVKEMAGENITVVLNFLTGEGFIEGSLSLCAPNAFFLEIGKRGIWTEQHMLEHRPDISYHIIALDDMRAKDPKQTKQILSSVLELFQSGAYSPISKAVYPLNQAVKAFQLMQQAKHVGKVIIKMPTDWKSHLLNEGYYLITGGLGGLGLKAAEWLVSQGAKYLVLMGRSKPATEGKAIIESIRSQGVEVIVYSGDISKENDVVALFDLFLERPLKGIIHAAGSIVNASLIEHTWSQFEDVFAPKISGALLMDREIQRRHLANLDFIVYYSSVTALIGGHSRAAYSAANSFMDFFAKYQQQQHGIASLSIQWGAWGEVGMSVSHLETMRLSGEPPMSTHESLLAMNNILFNQPFPLCVKKIEWKKFIEVRGKENPRFSLVVQGKNTGLPVKTHLHPAQHSIADRLQKAEPDVLLHLLQEYLATVIRKITAQGQQAVISMHESFVHLGIDSLSYVEFISTLESHLPLTKKLRNSDITQHGTGEKLCLYLHSILALKPSLSTKTSISHDSATPSTSPQKHISLSSLPLAPTFPEKNLSEQEWKPMGDFLKNMWYAEIYSLPSAAIRMMGNNLRLRDSLDIDAFSTAVNFVLKLNPLYFLVFSEEKPAYKVGTFKELMVTFRDISTVPDKQQVINENFDQEMRNPFLFQDTPRLRCFVYQLDPSDYIVQLFQDHKIGDETTFWNLQNQICAVYVHLLQGKAPVYNPSCDFLVCEPLYEKMLYENASYKHQLISEYCKHFEPIRLHFPLNPEKRQGFTTPPGIHYPQAFFQEFRKNCAAQNIDFSLALGSMVSLALSVLTDQLSFSARILASGRISDEFTQVIGPFYKPVIIHFSFSHRDTLSSYMARAAEHRGISQIIQESPQEYQVSYTQASKSTGFIFNKNNNFRLTVNVLPQPKTFYGFEVGQGALLNQLQCAPEVIDIVSVLETGRWGIYCVSCFSADVDNLIIKVINEVIECYVNDPKIDLKQLQLRVKPEIEKEIKKAA